MKKINYLLFISLGILVFSCTSQKESSKKTENAYARILFYNVENLFDTLDAEGNSDAEFTPGSEKKWNTERYNDKLSKLSKVIFSADSGFFPDLIGLAEIENRKVVEDLIQSASLKSGKYQILHQESPDQRGIDVALAYTSTYSPLTTKFILVDLPGARTHTRDILYSKGILYKDTVHVFVNHWPSRYGGKEESDPKRAFTAAVLRATIDSIQQADLNPQIIIMGDFNDYPPDSSLQFVLGAKEQLGTDPNELINLAWKENASGNGSYYYDKAWGTLDQFIVSVNLFEKSGLSVNEQSYVIIKKDWMLYSDKKGVKSPSKSYGGANYYGGYSDHLPILLKLSRNKD